MHIYVYIIYIIYLDIYNFIHIKLPSGSAGKELP